MTPTQSLSERLRYMAEHLWDVEYRIHVDDDSKTILDAADALDAKDAEIELLKEGRKLHDELADHIEHELAAQSALIAQAAAALEEIMRWWGEDTAREDEPYFITVAREALAALRANGVP